MDEALRRVVRRWQQLPLDRALRMSDAVRALAQDLADRAARLSGLPARQLADLGPRTAMDQLRVTVYDLQHLESPQHLEGMQHLESPRHRRDATADLAARLTDLLHTLG